MRNLAVLICTILLPIQGLAEDSNTKAKDIETYLKGFYSGSAKEIHKHADSRYCLLKSECLKLSMEDCKSKIDKYENACNINFADQCCIEKSGSGLHDEIKTIDSSGLKCLKNIDNEFYSKFISCM